MDSHVRSRPRYTVSEALDGWLADGLVNVAASTAKLYKDKIAKALREHLGSVRLTELTAGADCYCRQRVNADSADIA